MMPTVRIEDDVMQGLKSLAEPFTDTPNSVIRRLLEDKGVLQKAASQPGPAIERPAGDERTASTSQKICEPFLLHVLQTKFNGHGGKHEVTKAVIEIMKSRGFVGPADYDRVSSGEAKIENTIAWARNALKERGLISRTSNKGVWELTAQGKERGGQVILPRPVKGRS